MASKIHQLCDRNFRKHKNINIEHVTIIGSNKNNINKTIG